MIAPIYHELSETLEKYIDDNKITGRIPGVLKLSRELGVHHVTLSKAVRILEKKGILSIQGTKGTFVVDPRKNRPRTNILALVSCNMGLSENQRTLTRLNQAVKDVGYSIINIILEDDLLRKNRAALLNFPVDGFLFRGAVIRREQMELLRKEKIPIVSTARRNESWLDMADCDNSAGYELLLDKLLEKGHRRIAFLDFDRVPEYRFHLNNIRGIFQRKLGDAFDPELFYTQKNGEDLWHRHGEAYWDIYVQEARNHFFALPEPPTAIIAPFLLVYRLKEQLEHEQIRKIPEECSIAFVHDKPDEDHRNLSGVIYDEYEILEWGVRRLLKLVSGATDVERFFMKPVFVPGNSIGICNKKYALN